MKEERTMLQEMLGWIEDNKGRDSKQATTGDKEEALIALGYCHA